MNSDWTFFFAKYNCHLSLSVMYQPNLKSVALPLPEIIAIVVLGGVANPKIGEEEAAAGRGWYCSKERL